MKIIHKTLLLSLLLLMIGTSSAYAEDDIITSGNYEGVDWRITKDYVLELGNSGQEQSISRFQVHDYPWEPYRDKLKSVVFEGTVIGSYVMDDMFSGCSSLTNIDLRNFDTSSVTSMNRMFSGCTSLTNIDLRNFDTSSVTEMTSMFRGCSSLSTIDVSGFDTHSVTNMDIMFSGCSSLTALDLQNFDTSSVTSMSSMFYDCSALTTIDLHNFDTSSVTNMLSMFGDCSSLTAVDVSSFDTHLVTNMHGMFYNCSSLSTIDVSNFDTSSVTRMSSMFLNCQKLTSLDLSSFNASALFKNELGNIFNDCNSLTTLVTPKNVNEEASLPCIMYDKEGNAYKYLPMGYSHSIILYKENPIDPENHGDSTYINGNFDIWFDPNTNVLNGVHYQDDFFLSDNRDYNIDLAKVSLAATMTTMNDVGNAIWDDSYLRYLFIDQLGYKTLRPFNLYKSLTDSSDETAFGIAEKTVLVDGKEITILAVVIRSGDYGAEWVSNFRCMGAKGAIKYHYGFKQTANSVYDELEKYISNNKLDRKTIKVWITGFSRGAAVSNLLGKMMVEKKDVSSENLYCYTFATPGTTKMQEKQRGIFNTINPIDAVPKVPPAYWLYGRFGTDYYLSYKTNDKFYGKTLDDVKKTYTQITGKKYGVYSNHFAALTILLRTLNAAVGGNELSYYTSTQADACAIAAETLGKPGKKKSIAKIIALILGNVTRGNRINTEIKASMISMGILTSFTCGTGFYNDISAEDFTGTKVGNQHMPVAYWALLKHGKLHNTFKDRLMAIACPVDVTVYDDENKIVAEVKNNNYEEFLTNNSGSALDYYVDENGTKLFYIPNNGNYRVEITATGSGKMDYSVTEYDYAGNLDRRVYYKDISLTKGEEFIAYLGEANPDEDINYIISSGDVLITDFSVIGANEAGTITFNTRVEGNGSIIGDEDSYTVGDSVVFNAVAEDGNVFLGWYENGEIIETNNKLGVIASQNDNNRTLVAKFEPETQAKCNHQFDSWKTTLEATEIATGVQTRKCCICGYIETSTLAILQPTLPVVKISKPKAAKKAVTVKWKKVSKKNMKKVAGIQIQIATDPGFNNIVKATTAGKKKTSKKIKGLASKQAYWVRVRTYRNDGGVMHVSAWKTKKFKAK